MKWFEKHVTDRSDLDARQIRSKFGITGYGIYEVLQQIVAENMEGNDVHEWGFVSQDWTMETLSKECGVSGAEFRAFVKFCNEQLIIEKREGRMFLPKMMDRMNEYAKRQFRKSVKSESEKKSKKNKTTDSTDNSDSSDIPAIQHNTSQHNTTQKLNTGAKRPEISKTPQDGKPTAIGSILAGKLQDPGKAETSKQGGISTPWQDKAFREMDYIGVKLLPKDVGRVLKVYKDEYQGRPIVGSPSRVVSYLKDYPTSLDYNGKLKMFFKLVTNGLTNNFPKKEGA